MNSMDSAEDEDADAVFDPLHRNLPIPTFSSDLRPHHHAHYHQSSQPQPSYSLTYPYHNGRGVDNGIDSTTYF